MLFVFLSLMDFIKRWGARLGGDRGTPISVIVDEIATIVGGKNSPLAADLDSFINTYSRNYNVHFATAFQEPFQLRENPKILETLMSLGTKFFGRMTDADSARLIADAAIPYDKTAIKAIHRVPHITSQYGYATVWYEERQTYLNKLEQVELNRQKFERLGRGEFLVSRSVKEGEKPLPLQPFSINQFRITPPNRLLVVDVKRRLSLRDGVRVGDVLSRLANETNANVAQSMPKKKEGNPIVIRRSTEKS